MSDKSEWYDQESSITCYYAHEYSDDCNNDIDCADCPHAKYRHAIEVSGGDDYTVTIRTYDDKTDALAVWGRLCADVKKGRDAAKIEAERDALREVYEAADAAIKADAELIAMLRAEVERLRGALVRAERCAYAHPPRKSGKIIWQCRVCGSQRGEPHRDECPFAALDVGQGEKQEQDGTKNEK
jgi:rubrerythrin